MNIKKTKLFISAALFLATAATQSFAATLDFSDYTPIAFDSYDTSASSTASSGTHTFSGSQSNLGFYYETADWGSEYEGTWYPYYVYSWEGLMISNKSDTTIEPSYYNDSSYTSVTDTDASGVVGGNYAVAYLPTADSNWTPYGDGISKSDYGLVSFTELVAFDFISVSNTLLSANYFNTTYTVDGDFYWENLIIYGVDADGNIIKDTSVTVALSTTEAGALMDWLDVDISSLNVEEGLSGLYFELQTNDYGEYGSNAPSYFVFDDITYVVVPEPAQWAAIFGGIALALSVYRRRNSK